MSVTVTIVVLLAAVLHAVWNALTHAITDRLLAIALLSLSFAVLGLVAIPFTGVPAPASWPLLAGSVVVHCTYMIWLVRSYRLGAFNQVYPLARGMSPWVVALVALVLLGERMSLQQVIGVLVVSAGLFCLVFARGRPHAEELPAVLAAVLVGLLISAYTLLDGVGVRASGDSMAYAAWLFFLHGAGLVAYCFIRRGRSLGRDIVAGRRVGLLAGLCAVAAYALVLWAQTMVPLATVAALRETSVIVGAVIGAIAFREPFGWWRTAATIVVAAGIALIKG